MLTPQIFNTKDYSRVHRVETSEAGVNPTPFSYVVFGPPGTDLLACCTFSNKLILYDMSGTETTKRVFQSGEVRVLTVIVCDDGFYHRCHIITYQLVTQQDCLTALADT